VPRISPELCARCKGYKRLCGLPRCPILERFRGQLSASLATRGTELEGYTPPSSVVGEAGYPLLRVYYMVPPGEDERAASYHEAPELWSARREPLHRIIALRSSMVAASLRVDARRPETLYDKEVVHAALSRRPVDSEVVLEKPPTPRLIFDGVSKPVGPSSPARELKIVDNPRLDSKLESLMWDDVKAIDAIVELYRAGVSVYTIQRALSLGALGRTRNRRLVPTRWAITAVDDVISGWLRSSLRDKLEVPSIEVYEAEYLGNRFLVVLYPGSGWFEWIEIWHPTGLWTKGAREPVTWRVTEDPRGRTSEVDGGFSAARLAVLEHLYRRGRRADVLIVREITPLYYAPVGNWHIRETLRRALEGTPRRFDDLDDALSHVLSRISAPQAAIKASPLLRGVRQRRLTEFWPELA